MFTTKLNRREAMFIIQNEFAKFGRTTNKVNDAIFRSGLRPKLVNLAVFRGLKIFREKS